MPEEMDYVYEVYKEKSFSTAAKKLFVTQPALSSAIKKAEEKIGAVLFAVLLIVTEIHKAVKK